MGPIAVYEARFPMFRRRFELYDDSIRVAGSNGTTDFESTLPLDRIDCQFERLWIHGLLFRVGYWVVVLAVLLLFGVVTFVMLQDHPVSLMKAYGVVGTLGTVGLILALANSRKIEHVRFRTDAGIPVLTIPRDRAGSQEFDRFLRLLVERISKVTGQAMPVELAADGV